MASGFDVIGGGAELTAEQVVSVLIQPLMAQSVVLRSGPRIFDSTGGVPVRIPKIEVFDISAGAGNTASAGYWVGENTQIPEADPDFGQVTLLPSSLKSIKLLHRFSNELARHAVVDIATALQDAIVRRVGLAMDRAFLEGEGTNDTVRGILHQAGVERPTYTSAPSVDDLIDAQGTLMANNANPSCWFLNPVEFTYLRKLKDETGRYLIQPDVTQGAGFVLLGLRVFVTTTLTPGTIILADTSQIAVGRDLDASVRLLDQTYADWDQLALRVVSRWDIGLLNDGAVAVLTAA